VRPPHPNAPGPTVAIDEALIREVVVAFYLKVRSDSDLGPVFETRVHDWPEHLRKLTDFWSSVLLLSGQYKGTPLQNHLAIPKLTEAHFQQWLTLFRSTLDELCTPDQTALFMSRAERIATSFRMAVDQRNGVGPVLCPVVRPREIAPPAQPQPFHQGERS
jgi:hemoglobin